MHSLEIIRQILVKNTKSEPTIGLHKWLFFMCRIVYGSLCYITNCKISLWKSLLFNLNSWNSLINNSQKYQIIAKLLIYRGGYNFFVIYRISYGSLCYIKDPKTRLLKSFSYKLNSWNPKINISQEYQIRANYWSHIGSYIFFM